MLVCLTANHRNAPFNVLEALAAQNTGTAVALLRGAQDLSGAVVLSTCNRFEAYLDIADSASVESVKESVLQTLSEFTAIPVAELEESVSTLRGEEVVPHLFGVSSGLESVVIGEDEIAGQVRRSLEQARADGTATADLERLFQRASHTSKAVKSRTALGQAGRSLVRLALELASSRIADWGETRVLLIGTGQYAATTVVALRDRGVDDITVYSPSGRAGQFAARHSLVAGTSISAAAAEADLIITCTSRDRPVVTPEHIVVAHRRLVIDLGLPRNVDSAVGKVEGVELLDLETIRLHAPLEELNATGDAHAMVDEAVALFGVAEAERSTVPAIVALRKHLFGLLDEELARARRRGTWTPESEAELRHLVGVLLHTPSVRARELARRGAGDSFVNGLSALFGIDATEEPIVADTDLKRA